VAYNFYFDLMGSLLVTKFSSNKACPVKGLYDKHGAVIYGICFKLAGNEKTAIEIFKKVFTEMPEKLHLWEMLDASLFPEAWIIKHTYKVALEYLEVTDVKAVLKEIFNPGKTAL